MKLSLLVLLCLVGVGTCKPTQEPTAQVSTAKPTADSVTEAEATKQPGVAITTGTRMGNETSDSPIIQDNVIVLEKATPFVERISFDHATGCDTLHVPAHNGMYEANILHCFDQGKTMYCFPAVSKCFVLDITEEGEPGLKEQEEGMSQFVHHSLGIIDGKNAVVQTNNWLIVGSVDRADLPSNLASFRPDFAAFAAVKIPEDAEFLSDQRGTDDSSDGNVKRRKRQLIEIECQGNAAPVRKYHVVNPAGCEWLVLCPPGTSAGTNCDSRHITDWFYAACLCCPEHTRASQCAHCAQV